MNFLQKLRSGWRINESSSSDNPVARSQGKYKKIAKKYGLLSFNAFKEAVKEGEKPDANLFTEGLYFDSAILLEAAKKKEELVLKDIILFNPNNLNGHYVDPEEIKQWVTDFNQSIEDGDNILNVSHSQNPEDAIGYCDALRFDEDTNNLHGDVHYTRFNNSKFQDQLVAIEENKGNVQMGHSIEFSAEDWDWGERGFVFKQTKYKGIATTLVPSAPQTLIDLDNTQNQGVTVGNPTPAPVAENFDEPKPDQNQENNPTHPTVTESAPKVDEQPTTESINFEEKLKEAINQVESKYEERIAQLENAVIGLNDRVASMYKATENTAKISKITNENLQSFKANVSKISNNQIM